MSLPEYTPQLKLSGCCSGVCIEGTGLSGVLFVAIFDVVNESVVVVIVVVAVVVVATGDCPWLESD